MSNGTIQGFGGVLPTGPSEDRGSRAKAIPPAPTPPSIDKPRAQEKVLNVSDQDIKEFQRLKGAAELTGFTANKKRFENFLKKLDVSEEEMTKLTDPAY